MRLPVMSVSCHCFLAVLCCIFAVTSSTISNQTSGPVLDGGLTYGLVRQLLDDYNRLKQNYEISEQKVSILEQEVANIHQSLEKDMTNLQQTLGHDVKNLQQTVGQDMSNLQNSLRDDMTNLRNTSSQRYLIAEKEMQSLKQEIVILKRNNLTAENNIKDLSQKVLFLQRENKKLSIISTSVNGLQTEFRYISLSLLDLSKQTSNISTEMSLSRKNLKTIHDQVHALELFRSNISPAITNVNTGKVGFTAGVTSRNSTWSSGSLVFPKIFSNVGGGYDASSGVFTAPVGGNYVFYATIVPYGSNDVYVDIALNGISKVRIMSVHYSGSNYKTGTNMVILTLIQGDRVWVRNYSGKGYYSYSDAPLTTFSGFLL